jgi:DNA-directed RNA polymerase sigma subunit (sigma70/sigma32)
MAVSGAEALPDIVAQLNRLRDPVRVAVHAGQVLIVMHSVEKQVVEARDGALTALHASGYSLQDIAAMTGLSRARVHQITRQPRER